MRGTVKAMLIAVATAAIATPAALATAGEPQHVSPSIVGGTNATETYSFMTHITANGAGCGASLIRPTWIVTAKHCIMNGSTPVPASTVEARVGTLLQDSGGSVSGAKRIVPYPDAEPDVALIELSTAVPQKPITIAPSAVVGSAARIIGWGCHSDPCGQLPPNPVLQQLDTSILADSTCNGGDNYICIGNPSGHGACYGDSGGPAVVKAGADWQLVGATSGGSGLCGQNPSIYVDVPHVRAWIESLAGPDGGGTPPPGGGTNLALNKPATSSQPSCNTREVPAQAVNGSVSGGNSDKWCSGVTGAKSLNVDLGTATSLTKLVVKHAGAGGEAASLNTKNFTLATSADGVTWTTTATVSNNTASTTTSAVNVTARWIRLTTTDSVARIYEFEAYA
ncbi:MAG: hypothetical protein QOJ50_249 [Cryptosporangiaceae bacterium]|nr:hypothetical protein [Cryptosporangiaceae bacterium]